ncbi:uncharacterized protein LOC133302833 [Gastrolobium bilobum]|uniref:uncharacterized protein LOC133302833 n=1 Tax=Gastrolobium bilobum TaxID=150636 RepID=UPI002AAFCD9E|nr:uncharacterized protein LOC133302833 [Gastrolobium bilobum]
MRDMNQCLSGCDLEDIGFKGPDFTWKRGKMQERIDRACANEAWNLFWPNRFLSHLPYFCSDHRPILLAKDKVYKSDDREKPFRFLVSWMTVNSFDEVVKSSWNKNFDWVSARNSFETRAKVWHQQVYRQIINKKNKIYARMRGIDNYRQGRYDHSMEILQRSLWRELQEILVREELDWFQRSRCQWLKFGDKNSKFFHSATISRRRHNKVVALRNEDERWVTDKEELINMAANYFEKLFAPDDEEVEEYPVRGLFPTLSDTEKEFLARVPSREEIRSVVFKMGKFKAPGPDGLQAVFFQNHWNTVGESVCKLIVDIFLDPKKVKDINKSLICLIPKKDSPENMKEFRPISLCNVVYKAVTKIITKRLREFMPRMVAPNQCSFIRGRQSTDNIIIAQETVHSMKEKKGRKGWMMIKVDLEKAYDRLNWGFVRETLEDVGLHKSLTYLIMSCISSSTMNLLWNGGLTKDFKPQRGIRQGDPVSPYLFVLCVEKLAHLIQLAVDTKAWKPILLNKNAPPLSHLFFADDIILCAEASIDQAHVINQVLKLFSAASGQKVSVEKSRVFFSKNVGLNRAMEISECLGVGLTSDLGKYLRVNLNHKRVSRNSLSYVVDRVQHRLSSWKQNSLSLAGRITLAKAVLEALPAYTMQSTDVPISICKEVEKMTRGFIWGSNRSKRKVHLVSWENVYRVKEEGGLGLRDQKLINQAYAMKIGFGVMMNHDTLWARILRCKYKVGAELVPMLKEGRSNSNVWKGVCRSWKHVQDGVRIHIGNGCKTKFWWDKWVPKMGRLIDRTSESIPEETSNWLVGDCVNQAGFWQWPKFNKFLNDEVMEAISNIQPPSVNAGADKVCWDLSSTGTFSIKSAYKSLNSSLVYDDNRNWALAWEWEGPQRIRTFLWLLMGEKLLTNDQRIRRNFCDDATCRICQGAVEDCTHLFRDCCWSRQIWQICFSWVDISAFWSGEFQYWIERNLNRKKHNKEWRRLFGVICWLIWKERNNMIFNDVWKSPMELVNQAKSFVHNITMSESILSMAGIQNVTREDLQVHWEVPPPNWIKINSDGACAEEGIRMSCGGVARNCYGEWIAGFSKKLGSGNVLMAELWGVILGLEWAWVQGYQQLIIEVDSMDAYNVILQGCVEAHPCHMLMLRIKEMMGRSWQVNVLHVYRECNRVADWLARHAHRLDWNTIWYREPPDGCRGFLLSDSRVGDAQDVG